MDFRDLLHNVTKDHQTLFQNPLLYDPLTDQQKSILIKCSPEKACHIKMSNFAVWNPLCFKTFLQHFPNLDKASVHKDIVRKTLNELVRYIKPWSPDYTSNIDRLISDSSPVITSFQKILYSIDVDKKTQARILAFYIFGCPDSSDIDVALSVSSREELLLPIDEEWLQQQLQDLGYDISRGIDYNLIYIEENMIVDSTKGSPKETQTMIFETYKHHKQQYPQPFTTCQTADILDRIRGFAKFFLDHMKDLVGKEQYDKLREHKRVVYAGGWSRIEFVMENLDKIKMLDKPSSKSALKSLTMKIIQIILQTHDEREFTKRGLAKKLDTHHPGTEQKALYHLYRRREGLFDPDFIPFLASEFCRIACENHRVLEWIDTDLPWDKNPTILPDHLIQEFIKSPLEPTPEFIKGFQEFCPDKDINSCFPIKSMGCEHLPPNILKDHVFTCDQRSEEWHKLRKLYPNGTSGGLDVESDAWVYKNYHVIRGAIMEQYVMRYFAYSGYKPVTVGLMVKSKEETGTPNCAPDLLFTNGSDVLPVEIKCLTGKPTDNHDYRRAITLARHQLLSVADIVGSTKGMMVIVYVHEVIECRYCLFDLKSY